MMHTDEFEISLLREVGVCDGTIRTLQNTLARFEKKYGLATDEIVTGSSASARVDGHDRSHWLETYTSLLSWQQRKREFEDLYHQMKIAAPASRPA